MGDTGRRSDDLGTRWSGAVAHYRCGRSSAGRLLDKADLSAKETMMGLLLEILAFVCFVFAFAQPTPTGWLAGRNYIALGLALWVLGVIVGGAPFRTWW